MHRQILLSGASVCNRSSWEEKITATSKTAVLRHNRTVQKYALSRKFEIWMEKKLKRSLQQSPWPKSLKLKKFSISKSRSPTRKVKHCRRAMQQDAHCHLDYPVCQSVCLVEKRKGPRTVSAETPTRQWTMEVFGHVLHLSIGGQVIGLRRERPREDRRLCKETTEEYGILIVRGNRPHSRNQLSIRHHVGVWYLRNPWKCRDVVVSIL